MQGSDERRAAYVLLALAAAGLLVRAFVGGSVPSGEVGYRAVHGTRPGQDSLAARAARLARPLAPGESIDVDAAAADELARLPRIGPALATRIVAHREAHGPFGSLDALDAVPGFGPTTLSGIRPYVKFSGPLQAPQEGAAPGVSLNTATAEMLAQLPGIGPTRAQAILEDRRRRGPYRRLEDLTRVRGIGPGTIERLRDRVRVP